MREIKSVMELACVLAETIQPENITINISASISDLIGKERTLKEYETQIIQHYLDKYDKDVLLVAKNWTLANPPSIV